MNEYENNIEYRSTAVVFIFSVTSSASCYSDKKCGGSGQTACTVVQCFPSCSGSLEKLNGIVRVAIDRANAEEAKTKGLRGDMLGKDKVLKQRDDMSGGIASQLDPFEAAASKMFDVADSIFTPEFLCSTTGAAVAAKFKGAGFDGNLAKALDLGNATIGVSMGADVTVTSSNHEL